MGIGGLLVHISGPSAWETRCCVPLFHPGLKSVLHHGFYKGSIKFQTEDIAGLDLNLF